jgi:hypothetical protein
MAAMLLVRCDELDAVLRQRMKIKRSQSNAGFIFVDALTATIFMGLLFIGLYAGLAFGFNVIKYARENTRATQIMVERMESIRLYTYAQVTNGLIQTNFVVPYYNVGNSNSSLLYTGKLIIADPNLGTTYNGNMKRVTVRLDWITGKTPRTREMTTYVSHEGMQKYVY